MRRFGCKNYFVQESQVTNKVFQVNFAKIEREIIAHLFRRPKMIKLSTGVEVSEETVVAALKAAGISVELPKPKHIFKAGDVAISGNIKSYWRFILNVDGELRSVDKTGCIYEGTGQDYFEKNNYKFVGKQSDLLKN